MTVEWWLGSSRVRNLQYHISSSVSFSRFRMFESILPSSSQNIKDKYVGGFQIQMLRYHHVGLSFSLFQPLGFLRTLFQPFLETVQTIISMTSRYYAIITFYLHVDSKIRMFKYILPTSSQNSTNEYIIIFYLHRCDLKIPSSSQNHAIIPFYLSLIPFLHFPIPFPRPLHSFSPSPPLSF